MQCIVGQVWVYGMPYVTKIKIPLRYVTFQAETSRRPLYQKLEMHNIWYVIMTLRNFDVRKFDVMYFTGTGRT